MAVERLMNAAELHEERLRATGALAFARDPKLIQRFLDVSGATENNL